MKAIIRQLMIISLGFVVWYSVTYAVSLQVVPVCRYIDVQERSNSIYYSIFGILSLDSSRLQATDKPKMVILGASNAIAFRPELLQPVFPEYEVANLSSSGANIYSIRRSVELVRSILPPRVYRQSVFVAGIWLGTFARDDLGNIDDALLSTGLYRREGKNVVPAVPPRELHTVVTLLRPYHFWNYINKKYIQPVMNTRTLSVCLSSVILGEPAEVKDSALDIRRKKLKLITRHKTLSESDKKWLIDFMKNYEEVKWENMDELLSLSEYVSNSGGQIVFVDLPVPDWYKEAVPAYSKYESVKRSYFDRALAMPNVYYIDLADEEGVSDESLFIDMTHPQKTTWKLWCRLLREKWTVPQANDAVHKQGHSNSVRDNM